MSTRSLTRVLDTDGNVLVTLYRHCDGYVEHGMGDELIKFLDGMKLVDGIGVMTDGGKIANGMDCLAAQLVSHFKGDTVGSFYLYPAEAEPEDFNYKIYLAGEDCDVITLEMYEDNNSVGRQLYPKVTSDVPQDRVVEFLYPISNARSYDREQNLWRKIKVIEQDREYIIGIDLEDGRDAGKFKRFRIDKIVGGVSKIFESKA